MILCSVQVFAGARMGPKRPTSEARSRRGAALIPDQRRAVPSGTCICGKAQIESSRGLMIREGARHLAAIFG